MDPGIHKAMVQAARERYERIHEVSGGNVPPSGFAPEAAAAYWTYVASRWGKLDLYA